MSKTIVTTYKINGIFASDRLPGETYTSPGPVRIALLADLHDRDCSQTLKILQQEKPDLIFVAGDLMERHEVGAIRADGSVSPWTMEIMEKWMATPQKQMFFIRLIKKLDGSFDEKKKQSRLIQKSPIRNNIFGQKWDRKNGYRFIRQAAKIAPIYYSIGNHEWYHTAEDAQILKECGVTVLDNQDTIIDIRNRLYTEKGAYRRENQETLPYLRIGGLSTRFDREWLEKYSRKDGVKILLMHHPDYYDRLVKSIDHFDLILCGHVHGGQWRFFGHGIFAPGQGIFPKLHHGMYPTLHSKKTGKGGMIVSAGCSNTTRIPRFGNPCEVVILELI